MTGFRLSLALSLAAHAIVLTLLLLMPASAPAPPPLPAGGIVVAYAPSLPQPAAPPVAPPAHAAPPPPPAVQPPPPPIQPPPPEPQALANPSAALPPPPPPKPPVPPLPARAPRRVERRPRYPAYAPAVPAVTREPPAPAPPPQTAFAPPAPVRAPAPASAITPGYRELLSQWLERHKRYPASARENGEEGRAVLHFVVERSGRVANFAVIESTGHPDLDAALETMMRGATLPPFPAGMNESSISVSVAIRFSLGG